MKKTIITFLTIISISTLIFVNNYKVNNKINDIPKEENNKSNLISMMIETDYGTGKYQISESNTWPTEGYKFNKEKSKCENGGELSWNKDANKVVLKGNISDKCYVYFDIYQGPSIADVCSGGENLSECIIKSKSVDSHLLYHNSSLTNGAGDNSYRYAGGDYELTDKATSAGIENIDSPIASSTNSLVNSYCNNKKEFVSYQCSKNLYYTLQYDTSTTQYSTYQEALNQAMKDGYLINNNIKNYVCIGSEEETCPYDNLYRIIGVFDNKVKLIKADYTQLNLLGTDGDYVGTYKEMSWTMQFYKGKMDNTNIGAYYWNNSAKANTWSTGQLNTVNLNKNFLNNIGTTYSDKIETSTWQVGGNTYDNLSTVAINKVFQNEITKPKTSTTVSAKVGLMYLSDFAYAASSKYWTLQMKAENSVQGADKDYRSAAGSNWMHMGIYEWTITKVTDNTTDAIEIFDNGKIISFVVYMDGLGGSPARPVFFLKNSITYSKGTGSISDPIRIN